MNNKSIICIKITPLILWARQIEHILINVSTPLRGRKMLENDMKYDNSVNRGQRVLKTPI